jgi:hypothetical protein
MRMLILIGSSAAALALAPAMQASPAAAKPISKAVPAQAPSAERMGTPASARAPSPGHGYSERDRRMLDCLASSGGRYDPASDRIAVRPGVTRRCEL